MNKILFFILATVLGLLYSRIADASNAWIECIDYDSGGSTSNASSYTTTSGTPTANDLILAWVVNSKATTPDTPTMSGNGLTWVQIDTQAFFTAATPLRRITLFRAMGASPTAGSATIDYAGVNQTGTAWSIIQCSNVDTSGTNGSGAVVQSAKDKVDSDTVLTVTLAAFGSTRNATAEGFGYGGSNAATLLPGDGFQSRTGSASYATPNTSITSGWRKSNDTGADMQSDQTGGIGGIAVEIKNSVTSSTTFGQRTWRYRKRCTISSSMVSNTDQSNFSLFFYRSSDSQLSSYAQSDADDILFTSSDGVTQLKHEIESYTSGTGELEAWVKIPTLSASSNTTIYMYYGNASATNEEDPSNVWDSNFKGVWHMGEIDPELINQDSTSNDLTAHKNSEVNPNPATGKVNGGQDFEFANTDYDELHEQSAFKITGSETWSAWVKPESIPQTGGDGDIYSDNASHTIFDITNDITNGTVRLLIQNDACNADIHRYGSTTLSAGTWYYLTGVYNASTPSMTVYVNGNSDNGTLLGTIPTAQCVKDGAIAILGTRDRANFVYDGIMDEVRISNTARSSDWIKTEYNNQSAPTTYITCEGQAPADTGQFFKMFY